MRVYPCATHVALATVIALPLTDHRSLNPHAHAPSPRDQFTTIGKVQVVRNSTTSARTWHHSFTIAPEALHAAHLR